jgi:hypothetical protein
MGLDAYVRCNCFKEGRTKPFPFPDRLRFDEVGEPDVDNSDGKLTLDNLIDLDRWNYDWGCEHHGYLVEARIGNIAFVAHVRAILEARQNGITPFALLLSKVVYSGTHAGDSIQSQDAASLLQEVKSLESVVDDSTVQQFRETMRSLCEASIASGNPIVF